MNWPAPVRLLLWPLSMIYGMVARLRPCLYAQGWLKQKRLKGDVISVGNLTVGGTGKTPMVIWLAQRFAAQGKRVAILSRGYRGANGTSDEIELMKERVGHGVQFGVGKDRYAQGRLWEAQGVDTFLLDDGFQHLQLARDVDILLMDASRPLGQEALLPAGRLREPASAMRRAQLVVFTRTETTPGSGDAIARLRKFPIFAASSRLMGFRLLGGDKMLLAVNAIGTGPFYAFCGIGNPGAFFRDLESWHVPVREKYAFNDHHRYNNEDAHGIEGKAEKAGARALVTTEKDAQNLKGVSFEMFPVYVAVIDLEIAPEDEFLGAIDQMLRTKRGQPN
ncbi:MAG: tetraacyldisaccharide 4'-kinase [Candidatus Acidiferrum sp.]